MESFHQAKAKKLNRLTPDGYVWRASCDACGWYGVTRDATEKEAAERDALAHNASGNA